MRATAVAGKLGGKRTLRREITSEIDLAEAVRAGFPSAVLDHLLDDLAGWVESQADVYRVVGSARTLQRKRTHRLALSADESDRLARLARLLVRAEEALGDDDVAHRWLTRPNRALGGRAPLSLLDSDAGALAVERVLGRIEHGVHS
ncbi:MAG TPA: antitoxin Xre/MbcA/ParS toxin-binding domain-containing protein [Gemmatimonadaceae bacterium]|nr:antitoxin Xre/MbcA/ParS toxin-binding domain-containing protein [Gemmatimonadaceae bacterium]